MHLKEYIDSTFPGLVLKPGLNQQWKNGFHFDFAKELYPLKEGAEELNPIYFRTVYHQASSLFHDLFSLEDKLFFVTNIYWHKDDARRRKKKIKVYHHYIKRKDVRLSLKQEKLPYLFEDEAEAFDYCTSQFSLECTKQDIDYRLLIQAICNQDFPSLKPSLTNPYYRYEPDVFFINITKNIIFFLYDDRGCEVIAKDIETLSPLYGKYRDWVDTEEVERLFSSQPHVAENQGGR